MGDQEILLQNLKWPIESMFVGLRPTSQQTDPKYWHYFTKVEEQEFSLPNLVTQDSTFVGTTTVATLATATPVTITPTFDQAKADAVVCTKTIDRITITAHGIFLYNDIPANFFHQYTTYTYGGPHVQTPEDEGCLMIPFNLYPGTYQPSGHVNVSRAREFYIRFISSVIGEVVDGTATAGVLVVVASAINFLKLRGMYVQNYMQVVLNLALLYSIQRNRQIAGTS